jgi:TrmH family RNA methyltransferase
MCVILMSTLYVVTSPANPLIRDVRKAVTRGQLTEDGLWIAEGFHLLEEAVHSGSSIPVILVAESAAARVKVNSRITVIPDNLFQSIAATETSQGVIALVKPPEWRMEQLVLGQSMVVVLDGLQDPGNAGAIVRAAEAFGATGVAFLKGSASPFHPKTLRASAGSLFRIPFVAGLTAADCAAALRKARLEVYAAMPYTGSEHLAEDTDFTRRCAVVIGSEGRGVSEEMRAIAQDVAIPTSGVESLNAAVAAAVLLYETRRQRS